MLEASTPVGGGPKKLMSGRSFFWADLLVGDRTVLSARCILRPLGRPMNNMLFSWAEPWRGSRSPRDPGFVNPTRPLFLKIVEALRGWSEYFTLRPDALNCPGFSPIYKCAVAIRQLAYASHDRWIWHAFFGVAGSNNDINVMNQST